MEVIKVKLTCQDPLPRAHQDILLQVFWLQRQSRDSWTSAGDNNWFMIQCNYYQIY